MVGGNAPPEIGMSYMDSETEQVKSVEAQYTIWGLGWSQDLENADWLQSTA